MVHAISMFLKNPLPRDRVITPLGRRRAEETEDQEDEDSNGDEEDGDNIQQNEPSRGKVLRLLR